LYEPSRKAVRSSSLSLIFAQRQERGACENPKKIIVTYDEDESEAVLSLFHEILEYRIRGLLYREVVNSLIGVLERLLRSEKGNVFRSYTRFHGVERV